MEIGRLRPQLSSEANAILKLDLHCTPVVHRPTAASEGERDTVVVMSPWRGPPTASQHLSKKAQEMAPQYEGERDENFQIKIDPFGRKWSR